ncbi:hypothetical protein OK016_28965 [Vibrio chagasii]|nr:hypothetical protein [Vibrio chagasii]
MGNNERCNYYRQINPASKNDDIDTRIGAACYRKTSLGDEHKQFGLGRNAYGCLVLRLDIRSRYAVDSCSTWEPWLAGADPCIPAGVSLRSVVSSVVRIIFICEPGNNVCKGVVEMKVNGDLISKTTKHRYLHRESTVGWF